MTVVPLSTSGVKRLMGLAADTKPTSDVPVGSTFYETDTGASYIFNGSSWGTLLGRSTPAGRNTLVDVEKTLTWANSDAANTQKTATFTLPTTLQGDALYAIHIYNPSSVTALTLICINVTSLNSSDRDCEVARFSCPANSSRAFVVQGWMLGESAKLIGSNDTVLGGSDGFSAYAKVRAV